MDAADGDTAHKIALRTPVDVILLNYPMHLSDGTTLTHAIRQTPALRRLPIINLMSHVTPQLVAEAAADGVTHTLVKPTDVWTVLQLINACIERRHGHS
jgi:two-component system chemotaxis response regulator CheY